MTKKNITVFVACSAAASVLNYLTYPILSRLLPSSQFINITVALSLFTQASTFLSAIIALTTGLTKKSKDKTSVVEDIDNLQASLTKFFIGLIVIFAVVSPLLLPILRLPVDFVLPICLLLLISLPGATVSGHLNGLGELKKLGLTILLGALLQLGFCTAAAYITKSGVEALAWMAIGQFVTIFLIYRLYAATKLPSLFAVFHDRTITDGQRLLGYALVTSLAIMVVNILQVADLLIVNSTHHNQARMYTDLYIISRVVFFAGSIFIWPFLSSLEVSHYSAKDTVRWFKICGLFLLISLGAWLGLVFCGSSITRLLFGTVYPFREIVVIGGLSILYKLLFLIITTFCLVSIVFRRLTVVYSAIGLLIGVGSITYAFHGSSLTQLLVALCAVCSIPAIYLSVNFKQLYKNVS